MFPVVSQMKYVSHLRNSGTHLHLRNCAFASHQLLDPIMVHVNRADWILRSRITKHCSEW
jgi:hypothetical protein